MIYISCLKIATESESEARVQSPESRDGVISGSLVYKRRRLAFLLVFVQPERPPNPPQATLNSQQNQVLRHSNHIRETTRDTLIRTFSSTSPFFSGDFFFLSFFTCYHCLSSLLESSPCHSFRRKKPRGSLFAISVSAPAQQPAG